MNQTINTQPFPFIFEGAKDEGIETDAGDFSPQTFLHAVSLAAPQSLLKDGRKLQFHRWKGNGNNFL